MTKTTTVTTTSKAPVAHTYQVSYSEISGMAPLLKSVEAAYFQTDDDFTVFKDADGKAVYAIKNNILCAIERLAPKQADQTA